MTNKNLIAVSTVLFFSSYCEIYPTLFLTLFFSAQFLNKVLYAREGAKSMIDRTFVDLPWQVRLEVDGTEIEIPEVT
jgi:hypothetical protein